MKKASSLRIVVVAVDGDAQALRQRILQIAPQIADVAVSDSIPVLRELTRFDDYDAVLVEWHAAASTEGVVAAVRACPLVPVLVVSREPESLAGEQMLRLGAQDYLVKRETNGGQLVRAIQHAVERKRLDIRLKTTLGELGQANARLKSLALKDPLTGALNRRAFDAVAGQMLARARRHGGTLALLYCDLDGFKQVNDQLGHAVGDGVLRGFSERTRQALRRSDCLARLGGDEFVILLDEMPDTGVALATARRILAACAVPLTVEGRGVPLRLSIGIARFPDCGDLAELIRGADSAMYVAKKGAGIACFSAAGVEPVGA